MEVMFGNSLGRPQDAEDDGSYESKIRAIINDAIDYEISYLAAAREENQNYFYGNLPLPPGKHEDEEYVNRYSIVSTDSRDTVMSILPSLIRIFAANEHTVHYQPRTDEAQEMGEQATDYVKYVFWEDNDGFMILHSLFKDAMSAK